MAEPNERFLDPKAREAIRHLGLESYRHEVTVPGREVRPWYTGAPTAVLIFLLYAGTLKLFKPWVGEDSAHVISLCVLALGFYIRSVTKKVSGDVVASDSGVRLMGRGGWALSWSQIGGIRVQSKPDSTVIYTVDGGEKRLPFALAGPTQFDHNIHKLKEMFESHGLNAAYSVVESAPIPKRKLQLYQADLLRYLSVAVLIISMVLVAIYSQSHRHSPFTWIDAIPALIGIGFGVGLFVASQLMRNRIRAALSAVGEIQMGRANSLYRQLEGRAPLAYGCYRYPAHIADRDSFNLGCQDPKTVLEAAQKELYWTKEGLRLTPDGPVCMHPLTFVTHPDGKVTMSLSVIPPDWNPTEVKSSTPQRLGIWLLSKMVKLPEGGSDQDGMANLMAAYWSVPKFDPRYLEFVEE